MTPTQSSRFQRFDLSGQEEAYARQVNPYFFAYLQNKIADYADAVVEFEYDGKSPAEAVLEHEKLKAKVLVLEELMQELQPPVEVNQQATGDNAN